MGHGRLVGLNGQPMGCREKRHVPLVNLRTASRQPADFETR